MLNKDQFQGQWNQIKGQIKQKWGKLTDDDLTQISGKRDQLIGKLQVRYGYAKEKAEQELKSFESAFSSSSTRETTRETNSNDFSKSHPEHHNTKKPGNEGHRR